MECHRRSRQNSARAEAFAQALSESVAVAHVAAVRLEPVLAVADFPNYQKIVVAVLTQADEQAPVVLDHNHLEAD